MADASAPRTQTYTTGTPGADPAELLFQIHLLKPFNDIVHTRHLLQNQELLYDYCREHISCVVGSCNRRVFAEERELEVVSVPLSFKQYCQVAQRYDNVSQKSRAAAAAAAAAAEITAVADELSPAVTASDRMNDLRTLVDRADKAAAAAAAAAAATATVERLQSYSSFWFGNNRQIAPCIDQGLRHDPDFQRSLAGTGDICDIALLDVAAKVTAFAKFARKPKDNGQLFDPLEVKHFVYTRRRAPTFMLNFTEALRGIRDGDSYPFQIFDITSFQYDMLPSVDPVTREAMTNGKLSPCNVRLRPDVTVRPDALGVLVLNGRTAEQRTVLKQVFGYDKGNQRFEGMCRGGGSVPLVQIMLAFDESNQGMTLLRVQFVHFMEPCLGGVQYNEIIQAKGRGLRPNCHRDVAEHLRFVRTRVYVATPPAKVVSMCEMLKQGLDTEELLQFRAHLEQLERQEASLLLEEKQLTESLASKQSNLKDVKAEYARKRALPMAGAGLVDEDKEKARERRDYRKLLRVLHKELSAAIVHLKRQLRSTAAALKEKKPTFVKARKLFAELKSGKTFAFVDPRAVSSANDPGKRRLVTLYPELLDTMVYERIKAKHDQLAPFQELLKVRRAHNKCMAPLRSFSLAYTGVRIRRKAAAAVSRPQLAS